jgi:hypothetical protein
MKDAGSIKGYNFLTSWATISSKHSTLNDVSYAAQKRTLNNAAFGQSQIVGELNQESDVILKPQSLNPYRQTVFRRSDI